MASSDRSQLPSSYCQRFALLVAHWRSRPLAFAEVASVLVPIAGILYLHQLDHFGDYTPLILDPLFVLFFWRTNVVVARQLQSAARLAAVPHR